MAAPLDNWGEISSRVPPASTGMLAMLFAAWPCRFILGKNRDSKLGDFRMHPGLNLPEITVNHNLPPGIFLITLVHELAHAVVWHRYSANVAAHGREWKQCYRECLSPFIRKDVFPDSLLPILEEHLRKAPAATRQDSDLYLYFFGEPEGLKINQLTPGTVFRLEKGKTYRLIKARRSRYECLDLSNNRLYLIPGELRVQPV